MTRCAIQGCARRARARGWCRLHYERWQRQGDPLVVLPRGGARVMPPRPKTERPVCRFDGCAARSVKGGKGWCGKHHTRWYRHGDPSVVLVPRRLRKDTAVVLAARSVRAGDCLIWQGARLPNGYGVFGVGGQRYVHRAAYELVHGSIAGGLHVHHICRNRACVNPDHLVALTAADHLAAHRSERQEVAA